MGVAGQHHSPAALHPGKTRYPLYRRLGRPQGRSGRVRKISPPPWFDPWTFQPVARRYTDWAIAAPEISLLLSMFKNRSFAVHFGVVRQNNIESVIMETHKCIIPSHRWQHVLQYAVVSMLSDYSSQRKTKFFYFFVRLHPVYVARTRLNPSSWPLVQDQEQICNDRYYLFTGVLRERHLMVAFRFPRPYRCVAVWASNRRLHPPSFGLSYQNHKSRKNTRSSQVNYDQSGSIAKGV